MGPIKHLKAEEISIVGCTLKYIPLSIENIVTKKETEKEKII
jgi:hypothetical protein